MRRFGLFGSTLLAIFMPLIILILSSNFVLRASSMYTFHFNDSEVMKEVTYNVKGADLSDAVASYLSSPGQDEFQVYEDNRIYKDPIFDKDEQKVMKSAKIILAIELGVGLIALACAIALYVYLLRNGLTKALRTRMRVGMGITAMGLILRPVLWSIKSFRLWMYDTLIGIKLDADTTLAITLGDPLYKTYMIFATILGVAMLAVVIYVNSILTRENRIFS